MPITQAWINDQINALTIERDKARDKVNRAKNNFELCQQTADAAQEMLNEAYETLDRIDGCLLGLKEECDVT
jgi:uncharacterized coiled-coil DUF342 family protein